jgi:hypothetical protein
MRHFYWGLRTFFPGNTGRFFRGRFPGSFLPKTAISTHFGMGTFFLRWTFYEDVFTEGRCFLGMFLPQDVFPGKFLPRDVFTACPHPRPGLLPVNIYSSVGDTVVSMVVEHCCFFVISCFHIWLSQVIKPQIFFSIFWFTAFLLHSGDSFHFVSLFMQSLLEL